MTTIVRNTTKSKSGLFLLELIIAIVFFALSSVVCIQLFVKAHVLSGQSAELNSAVIVCQTAAEQFKAAGGDIEAMLSNTGIPQSEAWVESDGSLGHRRWYSADWTACRPDESAAYEVVIAAKRDGNLISGTVTALKMTNKAEVVYTIKIAAAAGQGAAQ